MPERKKPTGTIQRAVVTPNSFEVKKLEFPKKKETIESLIVEIYTKCVSSIGIPVSVNSQNDTNDFDFNATINGKNGYLELTEIAPLGSGGFKNASSSYEVVPMAKIIEAQIMGKAAKYAGVKESPIALLLYVTDWHFCLANPVVEHLQYLLHKGSHGFERIDILEPRADRSGELRLVFPLKKKDWSMYDAKSYESTAIFSADVSKPLTRDQWPGKK